MIYDQIKNIFSDAKLLRDLYIATYENLETLLVYEREGKKVEDTIFNQEFVDIIRKTTQYTLYGDCKKEINSSKAFNDLSDTLLPRVIKVIPTLNLSLKEVFTLSIISGLSGLDLKGAPSAASPYVNSGIPMRQYYGMTKEKAATDYLSQLLKISEIATTEIFDWDILMSYLSKAKKVVWFTDDYIESYFDLFLIEKILDLFPNLTIEVVPKNGRYGNDLAFNDMENLLKLPIFKGLSKYIVESRFIASSFGPKMGAANLRKLSNKCVDSINSADFVLLKGCRIFEMLQGGINAKSFSAFIVSRQLSEIVCGLNSKEYSVVLTYLNEGEYSFFGINTENSKEMTFLDGRKVITCASTMSEHYKRRHLYNCKDISSAIEQLEELEQNFVGHKAPLHYEIDFLIKRRENIEENLE